MASFELAIPIILAHEGTDVKFWVDDPDDLGGETVWGISMLMIKHEGISPRDLGLDQDTFTPGCLKNVSKDTCKTLYDRFFWTKYGYGAFENQTIATKVFDASVNCGPTRGAQFLQTAANTLGANLSVDGIIGPKTVAAVNKLDPKKLIAAICAEQLAYYKKIVAARPRNAKFLPNWTKRSAWGLADLNAS